MLNGEYTDHPSCLEERKGQRKWKKTRNRREREKNPRTNWSLLQQFLDLKGFGREATSSNVAGFRCEQNSDVELGGEGLP
jgi:hypothetical protein